MPLLLSDFAPALMMGGIGEPVSRSFVTRPSSFVCLPRKEHNHASSRANGNIHNGLFGSNPAQCAFFWSRIRYFRVAHEGYFKGTQVHCFSTKNTWQALFTSQPDPVDCDSQKAAEKAAVHRLKSSPGRRRGGNGHERERRTGFLHRESLL